jgi:nicotinate-nucleotide--dimethylbenzimidazole phosphoribosyltransferase
MELVRMCKEKGYTLLATGEMGIGNTTTSSAVAAALLGCEVEAITGRGAGLSREGLNHKIEVIKTALRKYELKQDEPLRALETVGGLDLAGLVGVFLGGAVYHIPVVLDGVISAVAALTAERLVPGVKNYMIPSHAGKEPATEKILQELSLQPVIRADLALGEGTGAVMMFALLDMAMALYDSTTTFQAARIEQYERYQ